MKRWHRRLTRAKHRQRGRAARGGPPSLGGLGSGRSEFGGRGGVDGGGACPFITGFGTRGCGDPNRLEPRIVLGLGTAAISSTSAATGACSDGCRGDGALGGSRLGFNRRRAGRGSAAGTPAGGCERGLARGGLGLKRRGKWRDGTGGVRRSERRLCMLGERLPSSRLEPQLGAVHDRLVGAVHREVDEGGRGKASRQVGGGRKGMKHERPQPIRGEPDLVGGLGRDVEKDSERLEQQRGRQPRATQHRQCGMGRAALEQTLALAIHGHSREASAAVCGDHVIVRREQRHDRRLECACKRALVATACVQHALSRHLRSRRLLIGPVVHLRCVNHSHRGDGRRRCGGGRGGGGRELRRCLVRRG